jgi:pimeloyl-ACP methyl ester carboxylesterase
VIAWRASRCHTAPGYLVLQIAGPIVAQMADLPDWIDRTEYPFKPNFFATPHREMHYVDEGEGEVIVFVHGNPTWSFMYRHLIVGLRSQYRCIAPDHIGFGLSDKPPEVSYLPQFHADNLKRLIDRLGLRDITLVVHDWGGPIGMAYAVQHSLNVKRLIVFNSTCWSLIGIAAAERFSRFVGSPLGRFLCLRLNALPRFVIPGLFADRSRLTRKIHQQYVEPFPTADSRQGIWRLVKSLLTESPWMDSLWAQRALLRDKPVLILSGQKDPTFGPEKLLRWQEAFPGQRTWTYPNIGHFVPEELGPAAVEPVRRFLEKTGA